MQIILDGKFKITKKIGQGSFGEIFEAISIKQGHKVAIKLESIHSKYPQLSHEYKVLMQLHNDSLIVNKGIPNVYSFGISGEYNYLAMDLFGSSLQMLLYYCSQKFTLKTTLMLADQMLKRIQFLHSRGFVHKDIKPQNFVESYNKESKDPKEKDSKMAKNKGIYIIDFGMSKKIISQGKHIPYAEGKSLVGTLRYSSLNCHYGIQPTRRDDLQSWFYCLYYFLQGKLPWQNQKAPSRKQKQEKVLQVKLEYRPELLCKNLPPEFLQMQSHIRSLKFDQKPNYELLKSLIKKCMKNNNIDYDFIYDWVSKRDKNINFSNQRNQIKEKNDRKERKQRLQRK